MCEIRSHIVLIVYYLHHVAWARLHTPHTTCTYSIVHGGRLRVLYGVLRARVQAIITCGTVANHTHIDRLVVPVFLDLPRPQQVPTFYCTALLRNINLNYGIVLPRYHILWFPRFILFLPIHINGGPSLPCAKVIREKYERVLFLTQKGGEGLLGSFGEDQPQDEGDQCLTE
jgi:hypothetical protein